MNIQYQFTTKNLLDFIPKNNSYYEINNLKEQIENLNKEINKLKKENSDLQNENNNLKNINKNLNNDLNIKNQNINSYIAQINDLKSSFDIKNKEVFNLNKQINHLNKEMNNLKLNANNEIIKFGLNEIVTLTFKSIDQKVDTAYSIPKTDLFVRVEEKLYDEYPEFKDLDNIYFTVNGIKIKRFRSIQENNLKNRDKILLEIYEP